MSRAGNRAPLYTTTTITVVLTALVFLGTVQLYPGSALSYLVFVVLSVAFAMSAVALTPSVFLFALAAFLTLGFLAKALAHLVFDATLIEPIGMFDGSADSWDVALAFAAAGLAGCLSAVLVATRLPARLPSRSLRWSSGAQRTMLGLLVVALGIAVAGYYLNHLYDFNRIGYPPALELPRHLQSSASFLVSWGFLLASLTLTYWLVQSGRLAHLWILYVCAIVGFLASITMGSRIQFLLYVFIALCTLAQNRPPMPRMRNVVAAGSFVAILFAGSLAAVSLERAYQFLQPADRAVVASVDSASERSASGPAQDETPTEGAPPANAPQTGSEAEEPTDDASAFVERVEAVWSDGRVRIVLLEVQRLAIMRWVGLEGVMTAAGVAEELGTERFLAGLNEEPARAMDSIYQQMSGGKYDDVEFFTFLTLPGMIGIASFSGSLLVVFAFSFACALAGHLLEVATLRATLNRGASAVCGVSLAYFMVQMPFPWTTFVFAVQILTACLAIGLFRVLLMRLTGTGSQAGGAISPSPRLDIARGRA